MVLFIQHYHSRFVRMLYAFFVWTPVGFCLRLWSLNPFGGRRFFNMTSVPDVILEDAWKSAQQNIANNPFPLNDGNLPHAADKRAINVQPKHVSVISCPDEPVTNLAKIDPQWAKTKDPSGAILVMMGGITEYRTVAAITYPWIRPRVYAAASEIPRVLSYEFENIILDRLGYSVEGR